MQQQSRFLGNLLLIFLGVVVILVAYSYFRVGSGFGDASFDAGPYAVTIAKDAYRQRASQARTGHNFGGGAIVLEYSDGSKPSATYSPIYEGYDSTGVDKNRFHSERLTHREWIVPTLTILKSRGSLKYVSSIEMIIFSQYHVCPSCIADMHSFVSQYQTASGVSTVTLTAYELIKTFYPLSNDPKKRQQPIVNDITDLQPVHIP